MVAKRLRAIPQTASQAPRRKRGRPPKKSEFAEKVFDHIPPVGGDPKPGVQIAAETGLTVKQVQRGVEYLRDHFPEFPLVSSPKGYQFTMDSIEVNAFRTARMRSVYTISNRTWESVVKPYVEQLKDPYLTRNMTKAYKRLLEDIRELVT